MSSYRARPSCADRAQAIVAVIAIHLALGALVLRGTDRFAATPQPPPTRLIDIALPPPPPPPPRHQQSAAQRAPGKAGKKALPSPVVAPPRILTVPPRIAAAPIAGSGSAPSAGASAAGSGTGAGGEGNGPGGGGPGGGIGADARLLFGGLNHYDYRRLRSFGTSAGRAVIGLLVGPDGRVAQCSIRQSSGDPGLDAELCAIVQPRMRWAPARDRRGRPLTVGIIYTAIWSRD